MPQSNKRVAGPGRAIDGISYMPGNSMVRFIDWEALKREFMITAGFPTPRLWLANIKKWPDKKILSGNTNEHIAGWGKEKAALQQKITERAIAALLDEERNNIPILRQAKLKLVKQIIQSVDSWSALLPQDKKLCYEILKTELGEPTSIKTVGLFTPKDPVEALLEEYGVMKEGRIIIDDDQGEGAEDNTAVATPDSGSLAEVPPSTTL